MKLDSGQRGEGDFLVLNYLDARDCEIDRTVGFGVVFDRAKRCEKTNVDMGCLLFIRINQLA